MKLHKTLSRILDGLILLVFLLFLSSAGFQDRDTTGWYQQWFPNLNGSTIKDITFLDSLKGFAVTTTNSSVQAYILKTTNGGDNWNIIYTYVPPSVNSGFTRIQFPNNSNTGYIATNYFDFFKTTDGGLNWTNYSNQPTGAEDFCAINEDTLFYVCSGGFGGGVYRSINGGINWTRIWTNGTSGNYISGNPIPNYLYFEECQMSHFPVIKELNRQIDSVSGGKNALVIWLNYDLFKAHVPDCWDYQFDAEMLKRYIYTDYGLRNIVMGSYALEGWETQDKETNL